MDGSPIAPPRGKPAGKPVWHLNALSAQRGRHPWLPCFFGHPWPALRSATAPAILAYALRRAALAPAAASRLASARHPCRASARAIHGPFVASLAGHPWPAVSFSTNFASANQADQPRSIKIERTSGARPDIDSTSDSLDNTVSKLGEAPRSSKIGRTSGARVDGARL